MSQFATDLFAKVPRLEIAEVHQIQLGNSGSWKVCWNDSKNKIISFYIFQNGDCKTSFLENNLCNKNYPSDVIIEYNKELTIDSEILKNLFQN